MNTPNDPLALITSVLQAMQLYTAPPRYTNDKQAYVMACVGGVWRLFNSEYLRFASPTLVTRYIQEVYVYNDSGVVPF